MPGLYWKWDHENNRKDSTDLEQTDLSKLKIAKPTVVYLPGRGQSDSNPTELSKGINFVRNLFSDLPAPPEVYIWSHSDKYNKEHTGNLASMFHIGAFTHLPRYISPAGRELAQGVIMPMVTDGKGKRLPFEQAQQNLRNLTLLSYCLGSTTAQEMHNAAMEMMHKAGYSNAAEVSALLREIVHVSFANFTRPSRERHRYTTVSFINSDDLFISAKNLLVLPVSSVIKMTKNVAVNLTGNLTSIFSNSNERLTIKELSSSSMLVSAAAKSSLLRSVLPGEQKEVIDGVKLRRWKLATNHEARDYANDEATKSQFACMVKFALLNAVTRQRTLRPLNLLSKPSFLDKDALEDTDHYNQKIVKGLHRSRKPASGGWTRYFY